MGKGGRRVVVGRGGGSLTLSVACIGLPQVESFPTAV
jgi:hypothetical protein